MYYPNVKFMQGRKKLTRSMASRSSGVTVIACGIPAASCPSAFLKKIIH